MKYWTDQEFIETVSKSNTIISVLTKFNIKKGQGGQYYKLFHSTIKRLNLDISHFGKIRINLKRRELPEILVKSDKYISSSSLRKRLLNSKILNNKCQLCELEAIWNGNKLTLQLDHINGDNTDNRLENLRLLCPNCHSQTDTYCGNKKERKTLIRICTMCKCNVKSPSSKICNQCHIQKMKNQKTKIIWPEPHIVLNMVQNSNCIQTAKTLGVSDSAVRKFLTKNGLNGRN